MQLLVVGASKLSTVECTTGLQPPSTIRRGSAAMCTIDMIDRDGDPIKGTITAFTLSTTGGDVSDLRVSANNSRVAEFDFVPPNGGDAAIVEVVLELTQETLQGGILPFDIADFPDETSEVSCSSLEDPSSSARAGGVVTCVIYPKANGEAVKAVPTDFVVTASASVVFGAMDVEGGGFLIRFDVTIPDDPALHAITVEVRLARTTGSIGNGNPSLDVAHTPDESTTVKCLRVEQGMLGAAPSEDGRLHVAEYEELTCTITAMAASTPTKALTRDFVVSAANGTVSSVVSQASGYTLVFTYHAPAALVHRRDVINVTLAAANEQLVAVAVTIVPHDLAPPYMRCTSFEVPMSSVRIGGQLHCKVYLHEAVVPSESKEEGLIVYAGSDDESDPSLENPALLGSSLERVTAVATSSAWLAYAFTHVAPLVPGVTVVSATLPGATVDGSPFTANVVGFPTLNSLLDCNLDAAFAAEGYVLRAVPVTCTILPVDDTKASALALFTDFDIVANGDVTDISSPDAGLSLWFNVTTPALGTKFTVVVTLAGGTVPIVNGSVLSELTDELPPQWVSGHPHVAGADKATATVALQLDEPCLVCVVH